MIRIKFRGMEFHCESAREAAELQRLLRSDIALPSSDNFDVLYIPGGKRPPEIIDGYDFIMAMKPLQGKEFGSVALAKRLRLKGTQGLGPFFARIERALEQLNPPRKLVEFIEKTIVFGKPTRWKVLRIGKPKR